MKEKNLIGQRFNKLLVIEKDNEKSGKGTGVYYNCKCDCNNFISVRSSSLLNKHTKSCGCIAIDRITKHGMRSTRIYTIWYGMKTRCRYPKNKDYKYYGGRGITYCKEWEDFKNFYNDMAEGYADDLTLDRKDVNGNYCKENCRWITNLEQQQNKRKKSGD